jgi:hypothetical protein
MHNFIKDETNEIDISMQKLSDVLEKENMEFVLNIKKKIMNRGVPVRLSIHYGTDGNPARVKRKKKYFVCGSGEPH